MKPILFGTPMVRAVLDNCKTQTRRIHKKAKYKVNDVLWVRETFSPTESYIFFKADFSNLDWHKFKWKPSIFMPKKHARIFLKVTKVSQESIQKISKKSCIAEGVRELTKDNTVYKYAIFDQRDYASEAWSNMSNNPKEVFMKLWDSINKKRGYGWENNPKVFVYEFKKIDKQDE